MAIEKQTHVFKVVGDCRIRADVHRPDDDVVRPVVVWIHGGALILGARTSVEFGPHLPLYLNAGYAVVSIDYRLAPQTKLTYIIEDLRDAINWVRAEGPGLFRIDPRRLCVVGHSAGGYLTLMSGFCVRPRPRALVAFYGYGDIIGDWYSKPDPHYCQQPAVAREDADAARAGPEVSESPFEDNARGLFYLYCRQHGLWPQELTGHDPRREPEAFRPFCPVQNVDAHYPPTMLLHGNSDTDVPYEQSALMAKALKRAGVDHELITIHGGGHGFDFEEPPKPDVTKALQRVTAFLARHTK